MLCAITVAMGGLGFYALIVLLVAATGPHNETEQRELRQRKFASRNGPEKL